ncbi:DNA repair protein recA homolog 1, chloroplastic isoform X1 [Cryptomeria japonica]|uniref:DNA repair protein recA homolog 1, chloroplastic isoform X1 n=1 Tax=Cryptomeria japonica TaxID=3369 RepID=UPI0027DA6D95|nr:DNA repair protein recA homolog 1, chloroplastic isoform X1 [Cryptomeria japonica]XP_059070052.1 DNA repair protein recA homolog 1, chloroplastic isoform X1 [Cryptomeria japonica]
MSTTLGHPCGPGIKYCSFSPFLTSTCKPTSIFAVPCLVGQKYFCSRLRKCVITAKSYSNNGAFSSNGVSDRQKALEAAMNDINSSFGKGSVTRLGSAGGALVETFPSGCLTLDLALSGGLPKGRVVEIYGPESSGKTTIALHAIAEVQKLGGNAMLVDAEHAFDPCYSKALGVDIESLIVCQPDSGEMALESKSHSIVHAIKTADRMCRSGAVDLICIDSVSALTPRAEIEGEIGMQQIGLQARLMSQALRKMSGNAAKAGCTLIFLNQIRYKIGVFYGSPEVTSGGIALKFFASVRLEIRSTGKIKSPKGDEDIGIKARVRVQKSKVSRPYKQAEFDIIFGEGVHQLGCILDCSEMLDIVSKKGSWYNYGDLRLAQGREKALQYLRDNPLVCDEIEKAVRVRMMEELSSGKDTLHGINSSLLDGYEQSSDEDNKFTEAI